MLIGGVLRSAVGQDVMVLVGFIGGVVRGLIWGVSGALWGKWLMY